MAYSVLMSVYAKENAAYFSDAVESMLHQSCPPDQFVLVCDGPLTPGLDEAIQRFTASRDGGLFRVLRLPENVGLGRALQAGLPLCDHDLVARMDSDDLALPLRMEHQLALMAADPELAAVGGQIAEFTGAPDNIQGYRIVPTSPEEVRRGAAGRNPMNHMTVLFRREAVLAAGGYQDLKGFEDYFLWGRMLAAGFRLANLPEVCVLARVAGLQARRGGREYFRQTVQLERALAAPAYLGCVVWSLYGGRELIPAEVFGSSVPVRFEGHTYCAPGGYDTYLRRLYGDYAPDPPPDKQVSHHHFRAWYR